MVLDRDRYGNRVLKITSIDLGPRQRGFSIQTNGNLPQTHRDGIGPHTGAELRSYLAEHGSKRQKALYRIQ